MSEKPIIFSAPMVRAILEGRKSQTRRALNHRWQVLGNPFPRNLWRGLDLDRAWARATNPMFGGDDAHLAVPWLHPEDGDVRSEPFEKLAIYRVRPPYEPSDTLWVKEAWHSVVGYDARKPRDIPEDTPIFHCAGPHPETGWIWGRPRSALSMPRWASRITLRVTGVKVERLQDISPDDARAEGCCVGERDEGLPDGREVEAFRDLWTSISGHASWEENPWVAAISFERINP